MNSHSQYTYLEPCTSVIEKLNLFHEIFKAFLLLALGRRLLFPHGTTPLVYILSWLHALYACAFQQICHGTHEKPFGGRVRKPNGGQAQDTAAGSRCRSPVSILVYECTIAVEDLDSDNDLP